MSKSDKKFLERAAAAKPIYFRRAGRLWVGEIAPSGKIIRKRPVEGGAR